MGAPKFNYMIFTTKRLVWCLEGDPSLGLDPLGNHCTISNHCTIQRSWHNLQPLSEKSKWKGQNNTLHKVQEEVCTISKGGPNERKLVLASVQPLKKTKVQSFVQFNPYIGKFDFGKFHCVEKYSNCALPTWCIFFFFLANERNG